MALALGPCCCDCGPCPTKAETGLPDALVTHFSVLTSEATGMPTDTDIGNCAGGDPYMRWTHSAEIVELLTSITWDYVESASSSSCGCCCFLYNGRKEYDSGCPGGTNDGILLGESPFISRVIGGLVSYLYPVGTDLQEPAVVAHPLPPICCSSVTPGPGENESTIEHDHGCRDTVGVLVGWEDSDAYISEKLYLSSPELSICVSGNIVTLCFAATIVNECKLYSGDGDYLSPHVYYDGTNCKTHTHVSFTGSSGCATNSTSTLALSASADLSGVSGANIWEKMKSAPSESWVSDYEHSHCNCGPAGCTDSTSMQECACDFSQLSCGHAVTFYEPGTPYEDGEPCVNVDTVDNAPVDLDCVYAVGTIDIVFADE